MKKTITFFLICLFVFEGMAQQPGQYSLYMLNKYAANVAYAGLDQSLSINGVFRKQWTGLTGSPNTQALNFHLPWYYLHGGMGAMIENEVIGPRRNTFALLSYNYWLPLSNGALLSFGAGAGFQQQQLNGSELRSQGGQYDEPGNISHNDPLLPLGTVTGSAPRFDAGVYYQSEQFEFGLSVNQINSPKIKYSFENSANIELNRNYLFIFAANFDLSSKLAFRPSLIAKSDLVETQAEISGVFHYNNQFFAGASFRGYSSHTIDAAVLIAGLKLNNRFTIAYAYDLSLSALRSVNQGSHEVVISYQLNREIGKGKLPPIIYNPRFL